MVVRIRLPRGASGLGGLIALVAVSCLMLAMWRLTSDLGWTGEFVIPDGILSHWQVWMAMTIATGFLAFRLVRYGRALEQPDDSGAGPRE